MVFELFKALQTFQRIMKVMLSPVKWQFALGSLDNIIIFWRTADKYIEHVCTVSLLLHRAAVQLSLMKCKFFIDLIHYLGHLTGPSRLEFPYHTMYAVGILKLPRTVMDLKSLCIPAMYNNASFRILPELIPPSKLSWNEGGPNNWTTRRLGNGCPSNITAEPYISCSTRVALQRVLFDDKHRLVW